MKEARDQFDQEVTDQFWMFKYLEDLPENNEDPGKIKQIRYHNDQKIKNAFDRAQKEFGNRHLSVNIIDKYAIRDGGNIGHIYCKYIRRIQEIKDAFKHQDEIRVKEYFQALDAFMTETDTKIIILFNQFKKSLTSAGKA